MGISRQTASAFASGAAVSIAATFPQAVLSGSAIVVSITCDTGTSEDVSTVADNVNAGNYPAVLQDLNGTTNQQRIAVSVKANSAAGTPTVTVTFTSASTFSRGIRIDEFTNVTSAAVDQSASNRDATPNTNPDGVSSGATPTLTQDGAIAIAFSMSTSGNNTPAPSAGIGWTDEGSMWPGGTAGDQARLETKYVTGTGAVTAKFRANGGTEHVSIVVVLDSSLPVIATQPTDQTYGPQTGSVTFSVVASNATSYQWHRVDGSGDNVVTGATSSSYTFTAGPHDEGVNFYCAVTNATGTTNSSSARTLMNLGGFDVWLYPAFQPTTNDVVLSDPTQIRSNWAEPMSTWVPGRPANLPSGQKYLDGEPLPAIANVVVLPPTGFETATAPNRAQLGPPRFISGDALPAPVIPPNVPGGTDTPTAPNRLEPRPQPGTFDPVPPQVFTATGFEHVEPNARPQLGPPRFLSGEPVPSSAQPAAGISVSPAVVQYKGPRVFAPGEPVPPSAVPAAGISVSDPLARKSIPPQPATGEMVTRPAPQPVNFDTTLSPPRPVKAPQPGAVDPPTPSVQSAAGIDTSPPVWRHPPPVGPLPGVVPSPPSAVPASGIDTSPPAWRHPPPVTAPIAEAPTPSLVPGAGIDVSPALFRQPPVRFFVVGEPLTPSAIPGAGIDVSPALARLPPLRFFVAGEPLTPSMIHGAGIDVSPALARLPPLRFFVIGEPLTPSVIPGAGIDVSPALFRQPPVRFFVQGEPYPPRVFTATGYETAPPVWRQVVAPKFFPDPARFSAIATTVLTAWGWDYPAPGARVFRNPPPVSGDALPVTTRPIFWDTALAQARLFKIQQTQAGEPLPVLIFRPSLDNQTPFFRPVKTPRIEFNNVNWTNPVISWVGEVSLAQARHDKQTLFPDVFVPVSPVTSWVWETSLAQARHDKQLLFPDIVVPVPTSLPQIDLVTVYGSRLTKVVNPDQTNSFFQIQPLTPVGVDSVVPLTRVAPPVDKSVSGEPLTSLLIRPWSQSWEVAPPTRRKAFQLQSLNADVLGSLPTKIITRVVIDNGVPVPDVRVDILVPGSRILLISVVSDFQGLVRIPLTGIVKIGTIVDMEFYGGGARLYRLESVQLR